jgi:membrane fusion protein (multidrug efflux system)
MTNTKSFNTSGKSGYKPWLKMLGWFLALVVVLGVLKAYGVWQMIEGFKNAPKQVTAVSTMKLASEDWQPELKSVGTLRAVRGVDLSIETAGTVEKVLFTSGEEVPANQMLLQLDTSVERAQLESFNATLQLSEVNYQRSKSQARVKNVSQSQLDADAAALRSARAKVEEQQSLLLRKELRSPFAGKLGISNVNPGQYLKAGDVVVSLQQLDPIHVDFYLPQQALAKLALQQNVTVDADSVPGEKFTGKITALDASVDTETRNIRVQATVANPQHRLLPGMFVNIAAAAGEAQHYLTVPQTSIVYNSFGDIVFVVDKIPAKDGEPEKLTARQVFVTLGPTRGDQVAILKGLEAGAEIITSGQLKLKNGSEVTINNTVQPSNNPAPKPIDQ